MHELTPNLTIADQYQVSDLLENHSYDDVVTLGYYRECPPQSTTHSRYVFPDGPHDYQQFEDAINHIYHQLRNNNRVLVHCQACSSRSPVAAATILALERNISLVDAINVVARYNDRLDPTDELLQSAARYIAENR